MTSPESNRGGEPDTPSRDWRLAQLHLLDRQLVHEASGRFAGKVDDLELTRSQDGAWRVSALLTGPAALEPRLPRWWAAWAMFVHRRLDPYADHSPRRLPTRVIRRLGAAVLIDDEGYEVAGTPGTDWIRRVIIGRIPGAGHATE